MYGLIGKMLAVPGKREELLSILMESNGDMPGCLNYVVARDPADENGIWVSEVWTDKDSHGASLQLPQVQAAIARARPIIAGFVEQFETEPVGGVGLPT